MSVQKQIEELKAQLQLLKQEQEKQKKESEQGQSQGKGAVLELRSSKVRFTEREERTKGGYVDAILLSLLTLILQPFFFFLCYLFIK